MLGSKLLMECLIASVMSSGIEGNESDMSGESSSGSLSSSDGVVACDIAAFLRLRLFFLLFDILIN